MGAYAASACVTGSPVFTERALMEIKQYSSSCTLSEAITAGPVRARVGEESLRGAVTAESLPCIFWGAIVTLPDIVGHTAHGHRVFTGKAAELTNE